LNTLTTSPKTLIMLRTATSILYASDVGAAVHELFCF
jgi:hypothetical protein